MKGMTSTLPTLPGCEVNVGVCDCSCTRKTTKLFSYGDPCLDSGCIYTHKSCVCNEEIALKQRHQVDDGERFDVSYYNRLKKQLRPLIYKLSPCSEDHVITRARGEKRALLLSAKISLDIEPIDLRVDGRVKMFLKDDKYHDCEDLFGYLGQTEPIKYTPPRCIQYRNKRYCLRLATYLHPLEEKLYSHEDWTDTPVFAKARNLTQRGQDLYNKWDSFAFPVAYLLDHSKYDAHVNRYLKKLEDWHTAACYDNEPELVELLHAQSDNRGYTKNGTKYRTIYTRMSGDQNTGCDNSKGNYAMICDVFDELGVPYTIYIDGDDSVVITEGFVPLDPAIFKRYGMSTKLEVVTDFQDIEFCQTKPVFDGVSWRMVRNPARMLARTPWTVRNLTPKQVPKYLASIGDCALALGLGLPIEQYVGHKLSKLSTKRMRTELTYAANREFIKPGKAKLTPPNPECRQSYARAWGISVEQQLHIESKLAILQPTIRDYAVEEYPFTQ